MPKLPAPNVTAGTFGGFVAVLVLHMCAANGVIVPPDVADSLPYALAVVIAHLWDCWFPDKPDVKPPAQPPV